MQFHVRYSVGIGEDRQGLIIRDEDQRSIQAQLRLFASRVFGGGESVIVDGFWHDGQKTVSEPVWRFETDVWTDNTEWLHDVAAIFANIARQRAVHVSIEQVYATDVFFDGSKDDQSGNLPNLTLLIDHPMLPHGYWHDSRDA